MAMFTQVAKITDHLYLCAAAAVTVEKIRQLRINFVINCTAEIPTIKLYDVETLKINLDDTPNSRIAPFFDRCSDKIRMVKERGGRTMVHCAAGVSRSSTICIAYLMKYHRMTLREAYNHVKTQRSVIRPNPGFFRQLIDYERRLFGVNSVSMVSSPVGMIPDVYKDETNVIWLSMLAGH